MDADKEEIFEIKPISQTIIDMINKDYTYAIVGASQDKQKFGYIVLENLHKKGFDVVPINPHSKEILGLQVYESVEKCPKKIDVVVFVVPPKIALDVLEKIHAKKIGIKKVWFQPGAESKEAAEFCKKNGIDIVQRRCIMVETDGEKEESE